MLICPIYIQTLNNVVEYVKIAKMCNVEERGKISLVGILTYGSFLVSQAEAQQRSRCVITSQNKVVNIASRRQERPSPSGSRWISVAGKRWPKDTPQENHLKGKEGKGQKDGR